MSRCCHCPIVTQSFAQLTERQKPASAETSEALVEQVPRHSSPARLRPTQLRNSAVSLATLFYCCFDRLYFAVKGSYLGIDVPTVALSIARPEAMLCDQLDANCFD